MTKALQILNDLKTQVVQINNYMDASLQGDFEGKQAITPNIDPQNMLNKICELEKIIKSIQEL